MEKNVVLLGLGLYEYESFLRYVLIQRKANIDKNKLGLYGYFLKKKEEKFAETEETKRLKFFLEQVGIEIVEYEKYCDMYQTK